MPAGKPGSFLEAATGRQAGARPLRGHRPAGSVKSEARIPKILCPVLYSAIAQMALATSFQLIFFPCSSVLLLQDIAISQIR